MLKIDIEGKEFYDESTNKFITIKPVSLKMEHSLIAISLWEAKYHVPFLEEDEKTEEQLEYYYQCMTITPNVDPMVYKALSYNQILEIMEYIKNPMTATWFSDEGPRFGRGRAKEEIVTSELIYYWMISLTIPVEFEKWHINRLLTLIQVCNKKNSSSKNKLSRQETIQSYDALNDIRRKTMNSKG